MMYKVIKKELHLNRNNSLRIMLMGFFLSQGKSGIANFVSFGI